MLLQFEFENFRSFKNEATLDLGATLVEEYSDHVINIGKESVLPIGAIYGANASGKSNIYKAFKYMKDYVLYSYNKESINKEKDKVLKLDPYLFDLKRRNAKSTFEVYFIDSEENGAKNYNYGFSIDTKGVKEEWLNYREKTMSGEYNSIFYRNRDQKILDLNGLAEDTRKKIKLLLEKEVLILSIGLKLDLKSLKVVCDYFLKNKLISFDEVVGSLNYQKIAKEIENNEKASNDLVEYLASFDSAIVGVKLKSIINAEKETEFKLETVHKMNNSEELLAIAIEEESRGILKLLAIYPLLQDVLNSGSVLFIDGLNNNLHPLATEVFIKLFLNKKLNKNNAQLIFTSHDTSNLNARLFRRDEIWFTQKDNTGDSSLYCLTNLVDEFGFMIKKDENYEENYLLGNYGAVPSLKDNVNTED